MSVTLNLNRVDYQDPPWIHRLFWQSFLDPALISGYKSRLSVLETDDR